jgi:hypothetical protein
MHGFCINEQRMAGKQGKKKVCHTTILDGHFVGKAYLSTNQLLYYARRDTPPGNWGIGHPEYI